jgi:predicted pyridoxine 5'-phosphate oxidase superfamily flavin-nucleotide-binding protein
MSHLYHSGSRALQDRFDTRRLADRLEERIVVDSIDDEDKAFIEARDMFFLATVDQRGFPSCSYKGGEPGFVRVLDGRTVAFPNYDGNGMYLSMGNLDAHPKIGMLFIDWDAPSRLRLHGEAAISHDDPLKTEYQEAQFIVRVTVSEVFPNCPRYIHRQALSERSPFVPKLGVTTPVPDWKTREFVADVLPVGDRANDSG